MSENNHHHPTLGNLARKIARTGLGLLVNRGELLAVEWQEERARLLGLLIWGLGFLSMAILGMGTLMATVVFLFPPAQRIYVAAAFTILFFLGAIAALFALKSLLKQEPFAESIERVRKDRLWVESLNE